MTTEDQGLMSREDLLRQAAELDASYKDHCVNDEDDAVIAACELFWGHGFSDEEYGSITEAPGFHVYRVHRWLVETDTQGFKYFSEHGTPSEAHADFASREDHS